MQWAFDDGGVWAANYDGYTINTITFANAVTARYVRFYPVGRGPGFPSLM